jgi:hypothetical protein
MITYRLALIAGVATALAVVPAAASAAGGQGRYTTIDVPARRPRSRQPSTTPG